jgi:hypothetical protein
MDRGQHAPDPSLVISGKAACLVVATAATALHFNGSGLGRAGRVVVHTQHRVADAFVGPKFGDAAIGLERYHNLSGTYDGADVGGPRMRLKWGNDASYCIEGLSETKGVQHLVGPHGLVFAGPCPQWGF